MAGNAAEFRVAMRPGKRRALPQTADGRLQDLIEAAKAHICAKVEHPFRLIKQQFGFQKTRLRGMTKIRCKANVALKPLLPRGSPTDQHLLSHAMKFFATAAALLAFAGPAHASG